ncbi:MAG: DUF4956 domain-containing protein, partial [Saprospiraceae bacterium]
MNTLEQLQERYISEFSNNVSIVDFVINVLVTSILVILLRAYYIRFGNAVSNRAKFSLIFLPLALGTLLIIMIVKSSIALSLGLVGALSIVRFRAAIKDPEELTFLFICIGLGLAGGANQPVLAIIAFIFIVGLLYIFNRVFAKNDKLPENLMYFHIKANVFNISEISNVLAAHLKYVALKRADILPNGINATFLCQADNV